jgi:acyl-CoA reductase-like NAD-dependent aldehyde dehydrogenase
MGLAAHAFTRSPERARRAVAVLKAGIIGVNAVATGTAAGASAWDGFVTTAVAEQIAASLPGGRLVEMVLPTRPPLYAKEI